MYTIYSKNRLLLSGLILLILGFLFYFFFRPHNIFLSRFEFTKPVIFLETWQIFESLPSFIHCAAFTLISASFIHKSQGVLKAALFWFTVNSVFELIQLETMHKYLPSFIVRFGENGTFDPLDMLAALSGSFLALGIIYMFKIHSS